MKAADIVEFRAVNKLFGGVAAVTDVDLAIKRGEFFSLLGPSGCGKTTLLRMLAGFESPTKGRIFLEGVEIQDTVVHKRPIRMVFQNYALFPHLSVNRNVAYGLRRARFGRDELQAIVQQALEQVELTQYGDRLPSQLSGGQKQRVALARALVCKPKLLLLDEPLAALDKKLREQMQIELRTLQRSLGLTFVFVTHDQEEALNLSDRIAVMDAGRIVQVAAPSELYERPSNSYVGSFIGSMNFVSCSLSESGVAVKVDAGALGSFEIDRTQISAESGESRLAIRPEKIVLHWSKPACRSIEGNLGTQAYFGDRSHYFVHVVGIDRPLIVAVQHAQRQLMRAGNSQQVWLEIPENSFVVYRG